MRITLGGNACELHKGQLTIFGTEETAPARHRRVPQRAHSSSQTWDESKHARLPAGQHGGGEFAHAPAVVPRQAAPGERHEDIVSLGLREKGGFLVRDLQIRDAGDAAAVFAALKDESKEKCFVLCLTEDRQAIVTSCVGLGAVDHASIYPAEVVRVATLAGAQRIWIAHNHPSGASVPSPEDVHLTEKIRKLAQDANISLEGHVVIGEGESHVIGPDGATQRNAGPVDESGSQALPEVEPFLETRGPVDAQTFGSPDGVRAYVSQRLKNPDDILIMGLDTKNRVAGLHYYPKGSLRSDVVLRDLLRNNATGAFVAGGKDAMKANIATLEDIQGATKRAEIRFMDVFSRDPQDGYFESLQSQGPNVEIRDFLKVAVGGRLFAMDLAKGQLLLWGGEEERPHARTHKQKAKPTKFTPWTESQHPRVPAGQHGGGEFVSPDAPQKEEAVPLPASSPAEVPPPPFVPQVPPESPSAPEGPSEEPLPHNYDAKQDVDGVTVYRHSRFPHIKGKWTVLRPDGTPSGGFNATPEEAVKAHHELEERAEHNRKAEARRQEALERAKAGTHTDEDLRVLGNGRDTVTTTHAQGILEGMGLRPGAGLKVVRSLGLYGETSGGAMLRSVRETVEAGHRHLTTPAPEQPAAPPKPKQPWEKTEKEFLADHLAYETRRYERAVEAGDAELAAIKAPAKHAAKKLNVDFWRETLRQLKEDGGRPAERQSWHESYIETVKKAISTGKEVPPEIIAQYPEFARAQTGRERYVKGRHTSFANRSVAVQNHMQAERGYKVKRQDGKAITPEQTAEIAQGMDEIESVLGADIRNLMRTADLTIAHTNGKHPFMQQYGGLFVPGEQTISVGTDDILGRPIRALAHEFAHWLDHAAGRKGGMEKPLWNSEGYRRGSTSSVAAVEGRGNTLIADATRSINHYREAQRILKEKLGEQKDPEKKADVERARVQLGPYWREPQEVFARLVEQYVSTRTGGGVAAGRNYENSPGWWTKADFERMRPAVERGIARRIEILGGKHTLPVAVQKVAIGGEIYHLQGIGLRKIYHQESN